MGLESPEPAEVKVMAGGAAAAAHYSAEGFVRVFFGVAGSFSIALIAVVLLKEKPLQTAHV